MHVRPATRADLAPVGRMVCDHPLFVAYGLTPQRLEVALGAALDRDERAVVAAAAAGAAPLGVAWWHPTGAFGRSAYLRLLLVAADATGRGVGAVLLDAVEAAAFARGDDLFALANVGNEGALRFYARRGYVAVGRLDDYVAPGLHEVLLRKRRPPATPAALATT